MRSILCINFLVIPICRTYTDAEFTSSFLSFILLCFLNPVGYRLQFKHLGCRKMSRHGQRYIRRLLRIASLIYFLSLITSNGTLDGSALSNNVPVPFGPRASDLGDGSVDYNQHFLQLSQTLFRPSQQSTFPLPF